MVNLKLQKNGNAGGPMLVSWRDCSWSVQVRVNGYKPELQGSALSPAFTRQPDDARILSDVPIAQNSRRGRRIAPPLHTAGWSTRLEFTSARDRRDYLPSRNVRAGLSLRPRVCALPMRGPNDDAPRPAHWPDSLLVLAILPLGESCGLNLTIRHLFQKSQLSSL